MTMPATRPVAVRLPVDLIEFVDEVARANGKGSRTSVIVHALRAERRRVAG